MNIKGEIKSALSIMGFTSPTPVQEKVIPLMLDGFDCLVQAPTGTGKTYAFGVPAIEGAYESNPLVQTLVLCPTRELAMQIERELKRIAAVTAIKITALFGGQSVEKQMADLRKKPQIVVGTPGRVIDHIRRKTLKLHGIKTLVLDEADEMLDMGFLPDIRLIVKAMPKIRQTALFSATLSEEIKKVSADFQNNPVFVKTTVGDLDVPDIKQFYIKLKEENKYEALRRILKDKDFKLSLVFCNTKSRVDALYEKLDKDGYLCDKIHGDLKQRLRDKTMRAYRDKKLNVLVATDVAARGIDVDSVEAVFNYDLPLDEEFYVHRIGRTARANRAGEAFSFATKKDIYRLNLYEKLTNTPIEELNIDGLSENFVPKEKKSNQQIEKKKIFCGIGSVDGFDEGGLKKFISQKTGISVADIFSVRIAEVYSFFEVSEDNFKTALKLDGVKVNGRFVAFEEAGSQRQSGQSAKKNQKNLKGANSIKPLFKGEKKKGAKGQNAKAQSAVDFKGERPKTVNAAVPVKGKYSNAKGGNPKLKKNQFKSSKAQGVSEFERQNKSLNTKAQGEAKRKANKNLNAKTKAVTKSNNFKTQKADLTALNYAEAETKARKIYFERSEASRQTANPKTAVTVKKGKGQAKKRKGR